MSEEIKEVKEIEMYSYTANGKELWTSNLTFAQLRANHYGTYQVYVQVVNVEN